MGSQLDKPLPIRSCPLLELQLLVDETEVEMGVCEEGIGRQGLLVVIDGREETSFLLEYVTQIEIGREVAWFEEDGFLIALFRLRDVPLMVVNVSKVGESVWKTRTDLKGLFICLNGEIKLSRGHIQTASPLEPVQGIRARGKMLDLCRPFLSPEGKSVPSLAIWVRI